MACGCLSTTPSEDQPSGSTPTATGTLTPTPTGTGKATPTPTATPSPTAIPTPVISGVASAKGTVNAIVTVTGTSFGVTEGSIAFGGISADVVSWTNDTIRARVPEGAYPGSRSIVVAQSQVSSAPYPFKVVLPPRLYVDHCEDGTNDVISMYRILSNGALDPEAAFELPDIAGNTFNLTDSGVMKLDVARRRLFVSSFASISVFDVDGASGALTHAPGSPFVQPCTVGYEGLGLALTEDGGRLYVACLREIAGFDVASDGMLLPIAGSPWVVDPAGPNSGNSAVLARDESLLYMTNGAGQIHALSIAGDGSLSPVPGSPFAVLSSLVTFHQVHVDGVHHRLYATDANTTIRGFSIDSSGTLADLAGSPYDAGNNEQWMAMGFTPSGNSLYTGYYGDSSARRYAVDAGTGAIQSTTQIAGGTSGYVSSVVVTPDARFVYSLTRDDSGNTGSRVTGYSLDVFGTPTTIFTGLPIFPTTPLPRRACSMVSTQ